MAKDTLREIIKNFSKQLEYQPSIENATAFEKYDKFVVVGMGGSNLAAEIIKGWKPKLDIIIHRDYGLPNIEEGELKERLIILSSYSGETEETISAFQEAFSRKLPLIVIASGGKLLNLARDNDTPYIQLPTIKAHPRFAIGLSIKATLKAMGEELLLNDVSGVTESLDAEEYEEIGKNLAHSLENKIPLIYSSSRNRGLAYFWKINFNETVKIPAFFNVFPELNHNEMAGFDKIAAIGFKPSDFAFIFLNDPDDETRIQKRMTAMAKIFEERGFALQEVNIIGPSLWHKSFVGILIAFWTSLYLTEYYNVDPEDISMIEDFKKSLL
jgi:glucose/mannose-6-phosphate isomerase